MPTAGDLTISRRYTVADRVEVWRRTATTTFSEATLVSPWLPTGPDWVDVSPGIDIVAGVTAEHDGTGYTARFTVVDSSHLGWAEGGPVAIVAQHYDGTAWAARYLVCWGFLLGAGNQVQRGGIALGERMISYTSGWAAQIPPQVLGRRNLAEGAAVTLSTATVASPTTEAPLEFRSQETGAASYMLDAKVDTVAVFNVLATPSEPTIGETDVPTIVRVYPGSATRGVAPGGEPRFIEISVGKNMLNWGAFEGGAGSLPQQYNAPAGEGKPAIRNDSDIQSTLEAGAGRGGGTAYRVLFKAHATPTNWVGWLQWIIQGATYLDYPFRWSWWLQAGDPLSIGKSVRVGVKDANPIGPVGAELAPIVLSSAWQQYTINLDTTGNYGGGKWDLKTWPFQGGSDTTIRLDDLRLDVGFNHDIYAQAHSFQSLWLVFDDAIGHEKWVRISFDLVKEGNWTIRPFSSIIICDDEAALRSRFDAGDRLVLSLKNIYPEFWVGTGARLKLVLTQGPSNPNSYASGFTGAVLEEWLFSSYSWTPGQAITRQSPYMTGAPAAENFPRIGFPTNVGSAFAVVDLGAYNPPTLLVPISATATRIPVSDMDQYPEFGNVRLGSLAGSERVNFAGKDFDGLKVVARGTGGTTPLATTLEGTPVYPLYDNNVAQGTVAQTGPIWNRIQVIRKPGTPVILAGAVLYSNAVAPGNPSTGGALWENHPDWDLLWRWAGNTAPTLDMIPGAASLSGGATVAARQARWICLVIGEMDRYLGQAQLAKVNELAVWEYVPASAYGNIQGQGVGDTAAAVASILSRYTGLPATKFVSTLPTVPIGFVRIPKSRVSQVLDTLTKEAVARVWCDPYNVVHLDPAPTNPRFDQRVAEIVWAEEDLYADPSGAWAESLTTSQVIVTGIDPTNLRSYTYSYPPTPLGDGESVEIAVKFSGGLDQIRILARAMWRDLNTRRGATIPVGAVPWVRPYQRHAVNFPRLDAGGAWVGLNTYVERITHTFKGSERGQVVATTAIKLRELDLS